MKQIYLIEGKRARAVLDDGSGYKIIGYDSEPIAFNNREDAEKMFNTLKTECSEAGKIIRPLKGFDNPLNIFTYIIGEGRFTVKLKAINLF